MKSMPPAITSSIIRIASYRGYIYSAEYFLLRKYINEYNNDYISMVDVAIAIRIYNTDRGMKTQRKSVADVRGLISNN